MTALPDTIDPVALREYRRIDIGLAKSDDPGKWRIRLAQFETEHGRAAMVELRAALALKRAEDAERQATPVEARS